MEPSGLLPVVGNLGGAVVVTFLFLWFGHRQAARVEELVRDNQRHQDEVMRRLEAYRVSFLDHNRQLAEMFLEHHRQLTGGPEGKKEDAG